MRCKKLQDSSVAGMVAKDKQEPHDSHSKSQFVNLQIFFTYALAEPYLLPLILKD